MMMIKHRGATMMAARWILDNPGEDDDRSVSPVLFAIVESVSSGDAASVLLDMFGGTQIMFSQKHNNQTFL